MKKFMEELANHREYLSDLPGKDSEAQRKFAELRKFMTDNVGRRALFKSGKESRVVTITSVHGTYILLTYKVYGKDYSRELTTTSSFNSLLCGDDRLDIE